MKIVISFLFAAALQSIFASANVCAQTVAIGHVSAEIVESVSASSLAVTGFDLNTKSSQAAKTQIEQVGTNYENVSLGEMKINSGNAIACNIVMKPATLSDNNGNGFTVEVSSTNLDQVNTQRADGNKTIHLSGKVGIAQGQASGLYQGSYTMVFAYN